MVTKRVFLTHVSAGSRAEPWRDLAAALGYPGEPRAVTIADLLGDRDRLGAVLGANGDRAVVAMEAFARFTALAIGSFDNSRLLADGMPPPPRLSAYFPLCAATVRGRTLSSPSEDDA